MKHKPVPARQPLPKKSPAKKTAGNSFDELEAVFEKHHRNIFYVLLLLSVLVSALLFDAKISLGGDDASYIQRGWQFLHDGKFPYFQGPGYPLFLALFISFMGMSVIGLKVVSLLCYAAFIALTYFAFRRRIPYTVLFAVLIFIAFNNYMQYYASQTYTECYFLFLESLCFLITFKIIEASRKELRFAEQIKINYGKWIALGVVFTILSITKTIAFVCIGSLLIYFIFQKQYKEAALAIISFIIIRGIYEIIVRSLYGAEDYGQFELALRVNPYRPELGHETLAGMANRFYINFIVFLSVRLYHLLNFPTADSAPVNITLAFATAIVFLIFTFYSYRKNKFIFFTAIYCLVLITGIFLGVSINWLQERLIVIVVHFIFIVLFYNFYLLANRNALARNLFFSVSILMLFFIMARTTTAIADNIPILKKNLAGDKYYGYPADMKNYFLLNEWAADNLPANSVILARKPELAFIAARGKHTFEGIYNVSTLDPDSVAMEWKSKHIQFVLLASLRAHLEKNDGNIVNPAQYMIIPYAKKYPNNIRQIKRIGDSEPAVLFQIRYPD